MKEARAEKYGRFLASFIDYTLSTIPSQEKTRYKQVLIQELRKYSFKKRKKGGAIHEGCRWELIDINEFNIRNPEHLAKLIKEGIHLMYQKNTARKTMISLLERLI